MKRRKFLQMACGGAYREQANKFSLILNLKTAKLLGIIVPPALLACADEVIE